MKRRTLLTAAVLGSLAAAAVPALARPAVVSLTDGLQYVDTVVGTGARAKPGQTVSVHYVGTLRGGGKFDSSRDRGTPFSFALGTGQVIPGWDEGIEGMRVGGRRTLIVPPALAYGDDGYGEKIPPHSTLVFDIELLSVR